MYININKKNDMYFNFAKQLFSNYNILQVSNQLTNNLNNLSLQYDLNIQIHENVRGIYNSIINKYYHNEITIKSNFINNVLLKSNNHVTFFEYNLGTSRTDLCKINRKSIAFEIKTDLDNFLRLEKQLQDYSEIFEEVYVICSRLNLPSLVDIVPLYCGIYSYNITNNGIYKFRKEKKAITSNEVNNLKQLGLLSLKELNFGFNKFNYINNKEALIGTILNYYPPSHINSVFKKLVKAKYKAKWDFLKENHCNIYEIDYQWFFKNNINPNLIYQ